MPTSSMTQEVTITLPKDIVEIVRSKVSSGEYGSESGFIEAAIVESTLPAINDANLDHWIRTEGVRRSHTLDADPSSGLTLDGAFAGLVEEDLEEVHKER